MFLHSFTFLETTFFEMMWGKSSHRHNQQDFTSSHGDRVGDQSVFTSKLIMSRLPTLEF